MHKTILVTQTNTSIGSTYNSMFFHKKFRNCKMSILILFIFALKFINYYWKVVQSYQFFRVEIFFYIIFVLAFFENEFSNHGRTKFNYVGEDINGCWFHLGIIESLKIKTNIYICRNIYHSGFLFIQLLCKVIQIN